jgi:D-sedoheptulose 7-phosphate isomerase
LTSEPLYGNSKNVIYAAEVSQAFDIKVIALTGMNGGKLKEICDVFINVPEIETFKIQELHLPVYHTICLAIESEFYG